MVSKDCLWCKFCKWSRDNEYWECTEKVSDNYTQDVEFYCACDKFKEREWTD